MVVMTICTLFLIACLVVFGILHIFLELCRFHGNSNKCDHIDVRLVSPTGRIRDHDEIDDNRFNIYQFFKSKRNFSAPDAVNEELRSKLEVNEGKIYLSTSTSAVCLNNINPWLIEVNFVNHCDFVLTNIGRCRIHIYFIIKLFKTLLKSLIKRTIWALNWQKYV